MNSPNSKDGSDPPVGRPADGTSSIGGMGRRDVLTLLGAVGLGSLAGCNELTGEKPAVETPGGGDELPDLSDVGSVYVGQRGADLPVPEKTPAVGITGEGNYVNDGRDWLGPIGMGTSDSPANPSHFASANVHGPLVADSLVLEEDLFDIRAFGAAVDGETDDLEAIQSALDKAAEVGGTVVVPKGTTVISDAIDLGARHSGVTLRGVGYDSHVRLAGGHRENHYGILVDESDAPVSNLTIEGLRLDGNREEQIREHGLGIQLTSRNDRAVDRGIVIRNIWAHDWMLEGIGIRRGGVMLQNVRVWNNRLHGIGVYHDNDATNLITGVYAWDNGYYGIDVAGGRNIVTDFVLVDNGWGFKIGGNGAAEMNIFANGSVVGSDNFGFQMTGPVDTLILDNIECRDNGNSGFRFDKGGVVIAGTLVASGNRGRANVHAVDGEVYVDTLVLNDADGDGLFVETDVHVGHVVCSGNAGTDVSIRPWGTLYADTLGGASRNVEGTLVEGNVANTALGGSRPDAREFETGTFVHDTDRDGQVWLVVDASKRDGVVKMS